MPPAKSPLDVERLENAPSLVPSPPSFLQASDGVQLAYREYPSKDERRILIFFHGGGAHSGASYQHLAKGLAERRSTRVVTPDMRGHGESGGRRGDSPSTQRMYQDVVDHILRVRAAHPNKSIYLGGHSSGAGLVLNLSAQRGLMQKAGTIAGYVFVAPQLGFRSKTERDEAAGSFAEVRVGQFVLNGVTFGLLCAHCFAVKFNYPESVVERDPLLVTKNSVSLANALTPTAPRRQLRQLNAPLGVWLAENDALIAPQKVRNLMHEERPQAQVHEREGEGHLSILLEVADPIGAWLEGLPG